ncbi:MAG: hypothetical protein ACOX8E_04795 [Ruminococcus sp.]|jgi:cell division protein FtsL
MANPSRRVSSRSDYYRRQTAYISGNTVRKLEREPEERKQQKRRKTVSVSTQRNRAKAMQMSRGYVLFLALISAVALGLCVNYLRMRSFLTTQTEQIASAESELSTLKADNDALYNAVMASVDLEQVRETAINKLGMQYPTEEQIITFDTAGNSYVRQYQDVPGT